MIRSDFRNPFLSFDKSEIMTNRLIEEFNGEKGMTAAEITEAAQSCMGRTAPGTSGRYARRVRKPCDMDGGNRMLMALSLLAVRITWIREINHGIPELINSYGMACAHGRLSVSHLTPLERPLRVTGPVDVSLPSVCSCKLCQRHSDDLDLIQLNSFGCGLDAVTTDQVNEILTNSGKDLYLPEDRRGQQPRRRTYPCPFPAGCHPRTQTETGPEKRSFQPLPSNVYISPRKCERTTPSSARRCHRSILDLLEAALRLLRLSIWTSFRMTRQNAVDVGLKYVNNDACYPSLIVVGQIMEALLIRQIRPAPRLAIIMSQTGGGCRASNYIGFIRRALNKAGYRDIPVISINLSGLESELQASRLPLALHLELAYGCIFGDILMKCVYRMRPYEIKRGSTNRLHKKWEKICIDFVSGKHLSHTRFKQICRTIIHDFDRLPIDEKLKKPKVGIVGEILVKFLPAANNHLAELLEQEGAEAVVPDLVDFMCYCFYNQNFKHEKLGFKKTSAITGNAGIAAINWLRSAATEEFKKSRHFDPPANISDLARMASPIVSMGNQTGEGWFLTGEMMELIHGGTQNIVCTQPFGCLPNHIVGKGVIKAIRRSHPEANIVAIDYDPGASEVNQLNRIKLMLSTAVKNMK
ncbi:MAG: hypothetical protein ACLSHW_06135 [Lachnospiraceae bacterium]